MGTYPIKILSDEQGTPFVPLVSLDSIQTPDGEKIVDLIDTKLSPEDIVGGQYVEITQENGDVKITVDLPASLNTINNLTTETSGQGALDAYQGKVLKDSIPVLVDALDSEDANKALSARQGKILSEMAVPNGGKAGQVLKKATDNDRSFEWGDAADPNAIVGDGSIMSIISLTYAEYKKLEAEGKIQEDTEYHITDVSSAVVADGGPGVDLEEVQRMIDESIEEVAVPAGGSAGQVLKKSTNDDYDLVWGDAADPNAIVGDGSIMKIVELSYKEYLELESNSQLQDDTEYHISDWSEARSTSIAYDIGDVYITSTPENPQERLGGIWELIDKGFRVEQFAYSGEDISNYVTVENNSVEISQFVVRRIGHNVDIRIEMSTLIDLADTAVDLMTINVNALGIKGFSYTKYGQLIGSDGGNGFVNLTIYDYGKVTSVDVLVRGDAPGTLPAGSSPRFYYSQEITMGNMLDDYCNQFYWKRTI